jgi:hypothetical protein
VSGKARTASAVSAAREPDRHQPFAEIDPIDAGAGDDAAVAVAPPYWQRLDPRARGDPVDAALKAPSGPVGPNGNSRSFFWEYSIWG